jgi:hypothetical protein
VRALLARDAKPKITRWGPADQVPNALFGRLLLKPNALAEGKTVLIVEVDLPASLVDYGTSWWSNHFSIRIDARELKLLRPDGSLMDPVLCMSRFPFQPPGWMENYDPAGVIAPTGTSPEVFESFTLRVVFVALQKDVDEGVLQLKYRDAPAVILEPSKRSVFASDTRAFDPFEPLKQRLEQKSK